jgi:hypothetical protein
MIGIVRCIVDRNRHEEAARRPSPSVMTGRSFRSRRSNHNSEHQTSHAILSIRAQKLDVERLALEILGITSVATPAWARSLDLDEREPCTSGRLPTFDGPMLLPFTLWVSLQQGTLQPAPL